LEFIIDPGVTCYAISKSDWDRGSVESIVLHKVKEVLVFEVEHLVCDPSHADAAGSWQVYAQSGWLGFLRSGTWVSLVQSENVTRA